MNESLVEQIDVNDPNFWSKLENENERNILKWNSDGEYNRSFSPKYQELLNHFHNLPEIPEISVGDIVKGQISNISKKEIIININYKDSIYVDVKAPDLKIIQNLEVGDTISVMITAIEDEPYEIKGSITELIKIDVANKLRDLYNDKNPIKAFVKEMIPAGFMLDIEMNGINVTAFMPNTLAGVNKLTKQQSEELLGKEINVMLETLQQEKGVYVVSRKKYLKSLQENEILTIKENLKKDTEKIYTGYVTGSKDFGVFVEFNKCLTGMIHKVNINSQWRDRLNEIKPGTPIDFYVKDVLKGNKIILTQILRKSLWDTVRVGNVKEGKIKVVKPFGAFVALDEETTGLIQNIYIEKAGVNLKKGDKVKIKVVSVIKDDRKIYLDIIK